VDAETIKWAAGIVLAVVFAMVGILYRLGQTRDDKQDIRAHEIEEKQQEHSDSISTLKADVAVLKGEVAGLRTRWHNLIQEVQKIVGNIYKSHVNPRRDKEDD
jgi:hypothetical protein